MPAAQAQAVAEAVAQWEGVEQETEQMILPSVVEEPIPHLPLCETLRILARMARTGASRGHG